MKNIMTTMKETAVATVLLGLMVLNCVLVFIPIFFWGCLKLLPCQALRDYCTRRLSQIASWWMTANDFFIPSSRRIVADIDDNIALSLNHSYMVMSNHQSWIDILVLQKVFNRKIPFLRFFIKDRLKWVPLLGFAWWALDCPFMKRHSAAYLKKNPQARGTDILATKKACEKFKTMPFAVMNFVEGTRLTVAKQRRQASPYKHLLKPKAGGLALVLTTMGEQLHSLIDVTIVYPSAKNSLWDYLAGRIHSIRVVVREIAIPEALQQGDYFTGEQTQITFRDWLNQRFHAKDALIEDIKQQMQPRQTPV